MAINGVGSWIREQEAEDMEWARTLAYITGTVDQELLLRNELFSPLLIEADETRGHRHAYVLCVRPIKHLPDLVI